MMTHLFLTLVIALTLTGCNLSPLPPQTQAPISPTPVPTYTFTATQSGTTAYDLISQNTQVETKDFGDAGLFIESINGLAGGNTHYWGFYINGSYAQQGVSQTILEQNDTIEFKYETLESPPSN